MFQNSFSNTFSCLLIPDFLISRNIHQLKSAYLFPLDFLNFLNPFHQHFNFHNTQTQTSPISLFCIYIHLLLYISHLYIHIHTYIYTGFFYLSLRDLFFLVFSLYTHTHTLFFHLCKTLLLDLGPFLCLRFVLGFRMVPGD
ncbi:hypothetical protein QVD17_28402 [Tagetes erecta]|uniref:Uncharacterized protein n=1 Tax=Tagetes erecta TaxID=13708 RepID=A0AAD8NS32_TARER|nr:hypothetical protein QVD17_28402 [Tagetes erecta]